MPGTQAARALGGGGAAHIARTSFLRHKATTPPPGLLHYQVGFPSAWCRLLSILGVSFLNIKGSKDGHTKASAGLGDEMKNAPASGSGAAMLSLPAHHPLGHRF